MKRIPLVAIGFLAGAFALAHFAMAQTTHAVRLPVPYVSEVPDGRWVGSWKNACEEASIAMVDAYYSGENSISIANAKVFMQNLFNIEHKLWNSDANTDAARTLKLINDNSDFNGRIVEAPTVNAIKTELDAGRPVIVPLNGFTLGNKNIPFLASGSGYHMFVIIGYDAATGEFIANDTGDTTDGPGHRYKYARLMNAIHDYDYGDKKTDGPSRAIFTYPKLAKTADSHRIYFLSGNTKQYVSHPAVFAEKGWSWLWVNVVSSAWLVGFKDGATINR
jgi:hypothetical protein